MPVIVNNHKDKHDVISSALHLQRKLETSAIEEEKVTGRYIRPIVLFQAQSATSDDNTTFEKLKAELLKLCIPEEHVKIKTANKNELSGIDLSSKECQVRYIITINALKEGWDCPFACILASLADKSSAVDVEHLMNSGFSDKDYRQKDDMPEADKQQAVTKTLNQFLFPEDTTETETIDAGKISFNPQEAPAPSTASVIDTIAGLAEQQNRELEAQINSQPEQSPDTFYSAMGAKVKQYRIREGLQDKARQVILPRFYIDVPKNDLFETGTGQVPLDDTILLQGFHLERCDKNIAFDDVSSDLYKVDLQETRKNEYTPSFTKIEDRLFKEPLVEYILAKPKGSQLKDLSELVINLIGDMYPIPDSSIRKYVESVFADFSQEHVVDFLSRKYSYIDKIKKKIRDLADVYAEEQFNTFVKVGKIVVQPVWKFPEIIGPGNLGSSIAHSLYEREGAYTVTKAREMIGML